MLTPQAIESSIIRNPVTISPAMTLQAVITELGRWPLGSRCGCLLVIAEEKIVGMLAERDIVEALVQNQALATVTVAEVLHPLQASLRPWELNDPLRLIRKFQQNCCPSLPLLDEQGHLLGLITRDNLLQALNPDSTANTLSAQRLRDSQRIAHVGSWEMDLQSHQAYWSEEVFRIFELDPEQFEVSYEAFLDLVHPEDRERVNEAFTQHLDNGLPYDIVHRLLMPDGRIKYLQEQCETLYTEEGVPYFCQGTVQDITQLTEAELELQRLNTELETRVIQRTEELEAQKIRYQALMEGAGDAIILANQQGYILEVNRKAEMLLGYPRTELMGMHFSQLHHPEDVPKVIQAFEDLAEQRRSQVHDVNFLCRNGELVPVDITASVIEVQNHTLIQGIFRDISERKTIELALRRSEAKYRQVFETALEGIWVIDADAKTLFCNPALAAMLGTRVEDMPGRSLFEFVADKDQAFVEQHLAWRRQGISEHYELPLRRPDGRALLVLASASPVLDDQGQFMGSMSLLTDITEQKRAEIQLRKREANLRTAQRIAQVGSYEFDVATGESIWSEEIFRLFGRPQALGAPTFEELQTLLHPEDRSLHAQVVQNAISQARPYEIECRFYRTDGSLGYCLARGEPLTDATGKVVQIVGTVLDLTTRKAAELAFQAKSEELNRFFSLSLDLMYIGTLDGRIVRVNQQWTEVLGYEVAELEGAYFMDYVHPDDWQKTKDIAAELMVHRAIPDFTNRYRCQDGSYRWLEWRTVISEDKMFAIARDITEWIEEEDIRRQRAERATLLAEISQRIRQSLDLQRIFDTACQEIRVVMGVDRVGIFKFYPDSGCDDGEFVAESFGEGILSVVGIHIHDHCFGDKFAPLYQQGRYAAMENIYDLEECHTNVLSLIQVRANLVMPLLCGGQLWGLLCLHQCHRTRQWQLEEIDFCQHLSNQLAIAIQQADLFQQLQQELQERQQAQKLIDERNQQLAQANEELTRANRLKDEFLANTSHELRTPLNAILGMAEGLQEEIFGAITPEQRKAIVTIERSGSHLLSLINDILDLAKIEAGHLVLDQVVTPVIPLCQSSLDFIKHHASQKGIQLETQFPARLPDLWVDERRIRQVLINLLNNAVKFTPPGGTVTLAVSYIPQPLTTTTEEGITRVRIYRQPQESVERFLQTEPPPLTDFVRIAVKDTGIGISDQDIQKLFQPFIQVDSDLNRQYEGTGLGLALVKRLVELHGGQVSLTSEVGVGSCFSIDLPCVSLPSERQPEAVADKTIPLTARDTPPLLLLAEDNAANALTMVGYLQVKGYRLLSAKDGEEALALAEAHHPDLILMDIQMPRISGLEAIQRIRANPDLTQTPIIALTALAMEGDRERCLAAGANEYISKPVKLKELLALIETLLAP
ncbi:PAS domain S-box protein [Synechocystis sp. LKSZ1]|uniref:PAS domain S-box protein n=1 Tax=Synechocystis sp. LKSZ1 TaxID=3144951 RepID=UPI00336C013F